MSGGPEVSPGREHAGVGFYRGRKWTVPPELTWSIVWDMTVYEDWLSSKHAWEIQVCSTF